VKTNDTRPPDLLVLAATVAALDRTGNRRKRASTARRRRRTCCRCRSRGVSVMLMVTPTVLPDGYVAQIEGGLYPFECFDDCPLRAAWQAIWTELKVTKWSRARA
jgi:hypothetical protein